MIGVDTNVLLRLFVDDDPSQHERARAFFAARTADDPAFVSLVVLAELSWVLLKRFGYPQERLLDLIEMMTSSSDFELERLDLVRRTVALCRERKASVADALVAGIGVDHGCSHVVTFDRPASRRIPDMDLLT